jgi:hypothetical protein
VNSKKRRRSETAAAVRGEEEPFVSPLLRVSSERTCSRAPQGRGAFAGRPVADDAELGNDTPQLSLARHPRHFERMSKPLQASARQQLAPRKV